MCQICVHHYLRVYKIMRHTYTNNFTNVYAQFVYTRIYTHTNSETHVSNVCIRTIQLCLYTSTDNFVYVHDMSYTHLDKKCVYTQFLSVCAHCSVSTTLALKHVNNIKLTYTRGLYTRKYTHIQIQRRMYQMCVYAHFNCVCIQALAMLYTCVICRLHTSIKSVFTRNF